MTVSWHKAGHTVITTRWLCYVKLFLVCLSWLMFGRSRGDFRATYQASTGYQGDSCICTGKGAGVWRAMSLSLTQASMCLEACAVVLFLI